MEIFPSLSMKRISMTPKAGTISLSVVRIAAPRRKSETPRHSWVSATHSNLVAVIAVNYAASRTVGPVLVVVEKEDQEEKARARVKAKAREREKEKEKEREVVVCVSHTKRGSAHEGPHADFRIIDIIAAECRVKSR